eukprot:TRINITY_DN5914_c0_g2_i8.p2 TRINITY_DN5914_c0_g2~~TRINITY_DN5914_c0_g2_i8.p2  ORF type:complete len:194 (-),score=-13.32 TRINITY_DN5914_c0_g2_i8:189-770(-)
MCQTFMLNNSENTQPTQNLGKLMICLKQYYKLIVKQILVCSQACKNFHIQSFHTNFSKVEFCKISKIEEIDDPRKPKPWQTEPSVISTFLLGLLRCHFKNLNDFELTSFKFLKQGRYKTHFSHTLYMRNLISALFIACQQNTVDVPRNLAQKKIHFLVLYSLNLPKNHTFQFYVVLQHILLGRSIQAKFHIYI